jgi:hypothetical protein
MRQLVEYADPLGSGVSTAVRFVTENGVLVSYALVLLVEESGAIHTVRVFDNTHGVHEMHRYTRSDGKLAPEPFHYGAASEAMNTAKQWIADGWREMVEAWRR